MRLSVQIEFDKTLDLDTFKSSVTVGRSPTCDLIIPHESVSRTHCRIEKGQNGFYLTDLGSSNGSFIDGRKLSPNVKTAFKPSSQLVIGKLECEVSETVSPSIPEKIVSTEHSSRGDYTATMRISRLDLNKPSITLENEKKLKVTGPRNPISEHSFKQVPQETESKGIYIFLFVVISLGLAWMMAPDF